MLKIQPYNVQFGSRIKMSSINKVLDNTVIKDSSIISAQSTRTPIGSTGLASTVIGTAFSDKAIGGDSFGIVNTLIDVASPHVTPQSIAATHAHPSTMGSIFSTLGGSLSDVADKIGEVLKKGIKDPS